MKRRVHQCLLGLSLLVIIPGALLGMLITVGAVGSGIESGFALTDLIATPLLLLPSILGWWGVKLFFRLYAGFLKRVRKALFWYYVAVTVYCGFWLVSTFSRDGVTGAMFAPQEQAVGLLLLAIPLLAVGLMSPDPLPASPDRNEEAEQDGAQEAPTALRVL